MPRIYFLRRIALLAVLLCGAMASAIAQQFFDNWNSAACGTTDVATLTVERAIRLQRVDIWYHWRPNETTAHFTASFGGEVIEEGELSRAECDPNQAAWCVARLEAGAEIEPGIYTIRTARAPRSARIAPAAAMVSSALLAPA